MTRLKFRQVIRAAGTAVALMTMLAGCGIAGTGADIGATDDSTPTDGAPGVFAKGSTMATIQDRGKLIVGTSFDVAPFVSANSVTGSPEGFDVELVKAIATGIFGTNIEGKISWIELDPRSRELALEQNKVDIVVGRYDISAARKRFVDFGGPYYITHQVVFAGVDDSDDAHNITSVIGLNGKKVCVVRGSTNADALLTLLPSVDTTDERSTVAECGVDLLNKKVSGVAADLVDASQYISTAGDRVQILNANYGAVPYGVGVKKDVTDLRQYVNDQITAWGSSGYESARQTYLSIVPGDSQIPTVDRY